MKINSKQMLMNKAIVFVENNIGLILIIIIFYLFIAYLKLYTWKHYPRVCNVAALLWLQCMTNVMFCLMRNELNFTLILSEIVCSVLS